MRRSRPLSILFIATVVAAMLVHCSSNEQQLTTGKTPTVKKDSFQTVRLMFAGDIMMHVPQLNAAEDSVGRFDFTSVFEKVAPIISSADIAVANLETTFGGKPYTGYPQFSTPDTLAWFIKQAGFDLLVTANNHSADRGKAGILGTIAGIDKAGLQHTGTFQNAKEKAKSYPLLMEKNGMKIAFLNYTYGTNGLNVPEPVIVNVIDTVQIRQDILAAKQKKADAIIVIFHWGLEYQREPNNDQRLIAKFCLANGVDAIIGAHSHVLQPAVWESTGQLYSVYNKSDSTHEMHENKGLVVYSLGNFISNQRERYRDGGMLFELTLKRNKYTGEVTVENPGFHPTWVYIQPQPRRYYILPAAQYESDSTFIRGPENKVLMLQYLHDTRTHMTRDGIAEKK
jgi:poly-gamma-glutamate capsule biosynthesis protein CapA/YwtB (metallophosphatase superfamily)